MIARMMRGSKKDKLRKNKTKDGSDTISPEKEIGHWDLVQVKGKLNEAEVVDADIITSVIFNSDGSMLAAGDKGGRVVIFQRNEFAHDSKSADDYNVYATFQSHEADFDYLKSLDIEEKINKICWLKPSCRSSHMLTTNDKCIKLFKTTSKLESTSHSASSSRSSSFRDGSDNTVSCRRAGEDPPETLVHNRVLRRHSSSRYSHIRGGKCLRVYSNAHAYNIHSITSCFDRDFFLSADDLRINLWNLDRRDTCFTIVDIKPENMEDLSEVITSTQYHPYHNSIFLYSSSRGCVRLCDTRIRSLCDSPAAVFDDPEGYNTSSKYSEVVRSVSDLQFAPDPRYFLSRDYLAVRLWDSNMTRGPIETYTLSSHISSEEKLCDLYENESIFDKFDCRWSPNMQEIVSGSYGNLFTVVRRKEGSRDPVNSFFYVSSECFGDSHFYPTSLPPKQILESTYQSNTSPKKLRQNSIYAEELDFTRKISTLDWHPTENILAVAAASNLCILSRRNTTTCES